MPGPARRQTVRLRRRGPQAAQHFERCINRLKQWRGLAMRCDKLAIACQAALHPPQSSWDPKPTEERA